MAIYLLTHEEPARFDTGQLADMYMEFGEDRADRMLGAAIEEIAFSLSRLSKIGPHGKPEDLAGLANTLARQATRCGLIDLARVARDVKETAARSDAAALGATMARLARVGDRSLAAIWGPCAGSV